MIVDFCEFPDDVFFDVDKDVWFKPLESGIARIGMTTILSFLAGRITKANLRTDLRHVNRNQNLATLESVRYFGAIKSPTSGNLFRFNTRLTNNASILNDSPYKEGWIAELEQWDQSILLILPKGEQAKRDLELRIKEMRVRCFRALPNQEMNSIGLECAATLVNLDELLANVPKGYVVHLISDDPTADIEMIRWSDQTKNELLESRKEGNLYHFLVRKTH